MKQRNGKKGSDLLINNRLGYLTGYGGPTPSGQTYYYQHDHEGSVVELTSASCGVLETYRYDAFGAVTIRNGSGGVLTASAYNNRFLFTGREYIKEFGIYEYRARTYHPGLGRFMSEDPKGFDAGDYNLFRYCKNDPEDLTDPMGLATAPPTSPIGEAQNPLVWRLHPDAFTSQMFDGPGGQTTDGTDGAWHSSQNFTMAPMSADSNVAGTLKRGEGLGNRYDSFRQAGKNLVSSNWDKAKQANSDAAHLHELNFPVGREQGFTDGHIVVGDLVLGGIAREAKGDLGFHVAELAANLPVGSNLIGYITIHPNADFEKKVVGHDIGVVNNWYGIQTKVYYQAPRSITNWGRYDAGPPKVIDN